MFFNLGPFLRKELVVLSRRRRTFWIRAGALAILSVLMIPLLVQLLVQSSRGYSVKGVAEVLFQLFVWTQFALVFVAAPAFSAGSISYERRLGMIDLLRLAAIRAPALTLGKFLGAAALPFLLVLSEVPFLFIWSLFGGIAPEAIFATLFLTATITTLFIAFGLFTSAVSQTAGIATVVSYLVALIYVFAPLWGKAFFPQSFESYFVHIALWRVLNNPGITPVPWFDAVWASLAMSLVLTLGASVFLMQAPFSKVLDRTSVGSRAERRSRRVWRWPVLWREIYCGGGSRVTTFLNLCTVISVGCLAAAAIVDDKTAHGVLGGITLALPPICGGVLGSIAVTLEKEGGSIAALLLTPSAATSVVLGKFAGACARTLPLAVVPFLLGFVRMEELWMWASLSSTLAALLLISTGTLFSVLFAKSAVSVAVTFAGTVFYSFCCCNVLMTFPMMMMTTPDADAPVRLVMFFISVGLYGVIIATVLAIAVGLFESRARDALAST